MANHTHGELREPPDTRRFCRILVSGLLAHGVMSGPSEGRGTTYARVIINKYSTFDLDKTTTERPVLTRGDKPRRFFFPAEDSPGGEEKAGL